jgi:hypothetical protein
LSRAATSFVLGYHGCNRETGLRAITGEHDLLAQDRPYHWLGSGIYFWENDPERALEWAEEKSGRGELTDPFVIGAVINLGNRLDLQVRENAKLLQDAYLNLQALTLHAGGKMPTNRKARKDQRDDNVLRYLDCAIINHLRTLAKEPFDTVRGLFIEGEPIYPGAEIFHKTHSEIAVCNAACIKGLFLPR